MAGWRGGKWRGRQSLGQIEELAARKVIEFQRKLRSAGLAVPEIPPVSAEYIALTITDLSVRGVTDLLYDGKKLSGLLDMERVEIRYEEQDPIGRQNFTLAHELGHYYLHYLPALEQSLQPTLFDTLEEIYPGPNLEAALERAARPTSARFFRCGDQALSASATDSEDQEGINDLAATRSGLARLGRREMEDADSKAYIARIIRQKELDDRIEWEANIFARGLLMPSELVRRLNKHYSGEVEAMAATLAVTTTALRYRLNGLGLRHDADLGLGAGYSSSKKASTDHQQGSLF